MLVLGTFEHSLELEQALGVIEQNGIPRRHILVVSMDIDRENPWKTINKTRDMYNKAVEIGIAFATACSVIGTSIGFALTLGPVIWGLAAAIGGFILSFSLYVLIKKGTPMKLPGKLAEVTVIVQCTEDQVSLVRDTMWKYRALTVGQFQDPLRKNE